MFGSLGMPELIVIFVIALLVFGPRKLPELGRSLGKGIAEFKRATTDFQTTLEENVRAEEQLHTEREAAPVQTASSQVASSLATPTVASPLAAPLASPVASTVREEKLPHAS